MKLADLREIIKELRQPFAPELVSFKIQSVSKKNADNKLIVAYVDARDVSERLNSVCPEHWATRFEPSLVSDNGSVVSVRCALTLRSSEWSVTREDVGEAKYEGSHDNLYKTVHSDAFKRAGVHFGIASSLYDLPQIWESFEGKYIPDDTMKELKERYQKYVKNEAVVNKFGTVFGSA